MFYRRYFRRVRVVVVCYFWMISSEAKIVTIFCVYHFSIFQTFILLRAQAVLFYFQIMRKIQKNWVNTVKRYFFIVQS